MQQSHENINILPNDHINNASMHAHLQLIPCNSPLHTNSTHSRLSLQITFFNQANSNSNIYIQFDYQMTEAVEIAFEINQQQKHHEVAETSETETQKSVNIITHSITQISCLFAKKGKPNKMPEEQYFIEKQNNLVKSDELKINPLTKKCSIIVKLCPIMVKQTQIILKLMLLRSQNNSLSSFSLLKYTSIHNQFIDQQQPKTYVFTQLFYSKICQKNHQISNNYPSLYEKLESSEERLKICMVLLNESISTQQLINRVSIQSIFETFLAKIPQNYFHCDPVSPTIFIYILNSAFVSTFSQQISQHQLILNDLEQMLKFYPSKTISIPIDSGRKEIFSRNKMKRQILSFINISTQQLFEKERFAFIIIQEQFSFDLLEDISLFVSENVPQNIHYKFKIITQNQQMVKQQCRQSTQLMQFALVSGFSLTTIINSILEYKKQLKYNFTDAHLKQLLWNLRQKSLNSNINTLRQSLSFEIDIIKYENNIKMKYGEERQLLMCLKAMLKMDLELREEDELRGEEDEGLMKYFMELLQDVETLLTPTRDELIDNIIDKSFGQLIFQ